MRKVFVCILLLSSILFASVSPSIAMSALEDEAFKLCKKYIQKNLHEVAVVLQRGSSDVRSFKFSGEVSYENYDGERRSGEFTCNVYLDDQNIWHVSAIIPKVPDADDLNRERKISWLDDCLRSAYNHYINEWNMNCRRLGKDDNCRLPRVLANDLNKDHKIAKDDCYQRYDVIK